MANCPYLGLIDDSGSHFLFATSANFCHKVEPVEPVKASYQEAVCLVGAHRSCPVFQQQWEGPLSLDARGEFSRRGIRTNVLWIGLVLVLAILVGIGINSILNRRITILATSDRDQVGEIVTEQSVPVVATDAPLETKALFTSSPSPTTSSTKPPQPTQTNTSEATQTIVLTSTELVTASPSSTSLAMTIPTTEMTPTPKPQGSKPAPRFRTPFGPQDEYVLHLISEGENLPLLSRMYDTTPDVIMAMNIWVRELGLRPNKPIVVMPGRTDASGLMPFSVGFTQEEITLQEFAVKQGVSSEDVRALNDFGEQETIPAGRWLIYPYHEETLTPSPTAIPTADLSKALTEPFGPHDEFVLHKVSVGESMPLLEKRYLTSADVIRAVNVIEGSIQVGQVLVIMPGQKETTEKTKFSVLQVDETTSIEKLAADLGVLYADILYYNDFAQGEDIPAGRWVIYPNMAAP